MREAVSETIEGLDLHGFQCPLVQLSSSA